MSKNQMKKRADISPTVGAPPKPAPGNMLSPASRGSIFSAGVGGLPISGRGMAPQPIAAPKPVVPPATGPAASGIIKAPTGNLQPPAPPTPPPAAPPSLPQPPQPPAVARSAPPSAGRTPPPLPAAPAQNAAVGMPFQHGARQLQPRPPVVARPAPAAPAPQPLPAQQAAAPQAGSGRPSPSVMFEGRNLRPSLSGTVPREAGNEIGPYSAGLSGKRYRALRSMAENTQRMKAEQEQANQNYTPPPFDPDIDAKFDKIKQNRQQEAMRLAQNREKNVRQKSMMDSIKAGVPLEEATAAADAAVQAYKDGARERAGLAPLPKPEPMAAPAATAAPPVPMDAAQHQQPQLPASALHAAALSGTAPNANVNTEPEMPKLPDLYYASNNRRAPSQPDQKPVPASMRPAVAQQAARGLALPGISSALGATQLYNAVKQRAGEQNVKDISQEIGGMVHPALGKSLPKGMKPVSQAPTIQNLLKQFQDKLQGGLSDSAANRKRQAKNPTGVAAGKTETTKSLNAEKVMPKSNLNIKDPAMKALSDDLRQINFDNEFNKKHKRLNPKPTLQQAVDQAGKSLTPPAASMITPRFQDVMEGTSKNIPDFYSTEERFADFLKNPPKTDMFDKSKKKNRMGDGALDSIRGFF